jgi:hypothetical protein
MNRDELYKENRRLQRALREIAQQEVLDGEGDRTAHWMRDKADAALNKEIA